MKKSQKSHLHIAVYFVFPRNRNQDDLLDTNFNLASSCNSKLQSVRKKNFFSRIYFVLAFFNDHASSQWILFKNWRILFFQPNTVYFTKSDSKHCSGLTMIVRVYSQNDHWSFSEGFTCEPSRTDVGVVASWLITGW